jgi:hypothetical protein
MLSRSLSRCLNFERLKFAARRIACIPVTRVQWCFERIASPFRFHFFTRETSCVRTRSQGWRIGSPIFDRGPSFTHRHDQRAQSHRQGESQRRRDACAVEGATGVCYSIWLGAWRSLVAHLPWEQGVGRSNRLAPTRASSSGGKSNGLLSRGSGVRIPSGAPSGLALDCGGAGGLGNDSRRW